MTIQYCSDLHLEFKHNKHYLINNPIIPTGDILILAGDIMPFTEINRYAWFWDQLAYHFEAVYWVPGNHEYYKGDVMSRGVFFQEAIRNNVFLVNNNSIQRNDLTLIFSTLWTSISPLTEMEIRQGMADYIEIKYRYTKFRPFHCNRLHQKALAFIERALKDAATTKKIVVSHHVPTLLNYPPEYKGSSLNEAFATELLPFIESSGIDYWLYGHHHRNIPDFEIGTTRLITNQLGYVQSHEQDSFRRDAVISL